MPPHFARTLILLGLSALGAAACGDDAADASAPDTGAADGASAMIDTNGADIATLDSAAAQDTQVDADTGAPDAHQDSTPPGPVAATWHGSVAAFMADYCVACHQSGTKDFRDYDSVVTNKAAIRCGVAPTTQPGCGAWPPAAQFPVGSGPKPTSDERQMVVDWVDADTPLGQAD